MVTRSSNSFCSDEKGQNDNLESRGDRSQGYIRSTSNDDDKHERNDTIMISSAATQSIGGTSIRSPENEIRIPIKHGFVYNELEEASGKPLPESPPRPAYGDDGEQYSKMPSSPMVTPPIRGRNEICNAIDEPAQTSASKHRTSSLDKSTLPKGVPHVYHDYSQVADSAGYIRKKTGGVTQPFPEKLHEMLTSVEFLESEHAIVSWLPHGRAFIVRRPKQFTAEIMPKYFKQTKLTSFQRQLNLYGFRRITQGPDAGAYYHEMFLKGRPGLSHRMARQKVKGTGHKQPADVKTEPNFYLMSPLTIPPPSTENFEEESPVSASVSTPPVASKPLNQVKHIEGQKSLPLLPTSVEGAARSDGQYVRRGTHQAKAEHPYSEHNFSQPVSFISSSVETYSPAAQGEQTTPTTWRQQSSFASFPVSPGLQGAAHLLRGIASGYLRIPDAAYLVSSERGERDSITDMREGLGDDRKREPDLCPRSYDMGPSSTILQPRLSAPEFQEDEEEET